MITRQLSLKSADVNARDGQLAHPLLTCRGRYGVFSLFPQVKSDTDDAALCCMMLCVLLHQVRLSATWFPEVFEASLQLLHRRAGQRGRCYSCKSPESINTNDTIIKRSER